MRIRKNIIQVLLMAASVTLASAGACWAQGGGARVGVLTPGLLYGPMFSGLKAGLEKFGYQPEKNLTFIVEDTHGDVSELAGRAQKLIDVKPAALFTVGAFCSQAVKQATSTIPIVFSGVADPVRSGLIAGYQSSRNNLTGVATYAGPLSAKRLELLKEVAPKTQRALVLISSSDAPAQEARQPVEEAAKKLRIHLVYREVKGQGDVEKILTATPKGSMDAIFHFPSMLVGANMDSIIKKAREDKIPLVVPNENMVTEGALLGYGSDFRQVGAQAARLLAKVLKGESPSEIPVELPERFFLSVNASTAKAIGLKIPRTILEKVDRVVE